MSLFDLDDDESSSVSSSEERQDPVNTAAPSLANTHSAPVPALSADAIRARMGLPGRYAVTAADAAKLTQRQREAMERRLSSTGAGSLPHTDSGVRGSKFGNSIAAALQLRKEDQEQLVLERIRKQREQDANTPALVEKDLDVGIFVTPSYKQILKKHYKAAAKKTRNLGQRNGGVTDDTQSGNSTSEDENGEEATKSEQDEEQEEEDALDAYLKQFARPTTASHSPSQDDFYTASMRQAVRDGARQAQPDLSSHAPTADPLAELAPAPELTVVAPPSLDELQQILGLPSGGAEQHPAAAAAAAGAPFAASAESAVSHNASKIEAPQSTLADATREHLTTLFRAREARRRKRADEAFIAGCAQRCDARILRGIRLEH